MATSKSKRRKGLQLDHILHFLALLLVILVCVFPFYWMVTASFKQQSAILASTPQFFFQPTFENYVNAFSKFDILKSLQNSLFVALVTVLISLVLGTPAAYAIARFEFKAKQDIWFWFISNRMLSPIVVALPFSLDRPQFQTPGYHLGTYPDLPHIQRADRGTGSVPDQFRNIPKELDEAATLEGYNSFAIFLKIALPLAAPALAVSAIFCFIFSWNELLYALILTRNEAKTAPVVATSFMSGYELPWGQIMATGTMVALPVIIFSMIVSRQLVRGLTAGAIK